MIFLGRLHCPRLLCRRLYHGNNDRKNITKTSIFFILSIICQVGKNQGSVTWRVDVRQDQKIFFFWWHQMFFFLYIPVHQHFIVPINNIYAMDKELNILTRTQNIWYNHFQMERGFLNGPSSVKGRTQSERCTENINTGRFIYYRHVYYVF